MPDLQNALKLANAALEKQPNSAILKALKSIALVRTGKHDDANKVRCLWLMASQPCSVCGTCHAELYKS